LFPEIKNKTREIDFRSLCECFPQAVNFLGLGGLAASAVAHPELFIDNCAFVAGRRELAAAVSA
jgi:hypothetical protein